MITVEIIKEGRPNTLAQLGKWQQQRDEPEFRKREWSIALKKYMIAEMGVMKEIAKWQDITANTALEDDVDPTIVEQFQQHVEALKRVRAFIQKKIKELQASKQKMNPHTGEKQVLFSPQYIITQSRFAYDEDIIWGRDLAEEHIIKMRDILVKADKTPNL